MNTNLVSRAVVAALAAVAVAPVAQVDAKTIAPKAAAVGLPTGFTDITQVPAANILYISGSTAIDPVLKYWGISTADTSRLCAPSTATIYAQKSTFTAVACTASSAFAASGISAGSLVAFVKEDAAGSLNGILPLMNKSVPGSTYSTDGKLLFPNIAEMGYSGTSSASSGATCYGATKSVSTGAVDVYLDLTCKSVNSSRAYPQLGYSDVEASIFGVTPANLTTGNTVQLVFGVATNVGFYRALQTIQGKTADDAVGNMPSLTRTEIAALLNGNLAPTQLLGTSNTNSAAAASVNWGYQTGACYNATGANQTPASSSTPCSSAVTSDVNYVYICRRGDTSGSEKAAEIFFNDQNCGFATGQILGTATNSTAICTSGTTTDGCSWTAGTAYQTGVYSFTGSGTGDLIDCLVGQDNAGHFAIGFASVDNLPGVSNSTSTTTRRDFRYIRVDGVAPSIENAAAGKYQFIAESVYYVPTTQLNPVSGVAASLLSLFTSGAQGIGSVNSVSAINAALGNATNSQGFNSGALVIPKPGASGTATGNLSPVAVNATTTQFAASPISTIVKQAGGSTNNCIRAQSFSNNAFSNNVGTGGNYSWIDATKN
jgi:hypothetical protein